MSTPLHRALGLGTAQSGTEHFWLQRVTGVANLLTIVLGIVVALALAGQPYAEAANLLSSPPVSILLIALLVSVLTHMRLGMQVIIEDYVHGEWLKPALLIANTLFVWAVGIAGGLSVIKLAVGKLGLGG